MTTDTVTETTDRRLSDEQREQLAEWLVRSNGEGCDLLDCYAVELDVVLDLNPDGPTQADEQRVTRLVSKATVTVHMPTLED